MATKMLNLRKTLKNQPLRINKGDKAETFVEMLIIASLKCCRCLCAFVAMAT